MTLGVPLDQMFQGADPLLGRDLLYGEVPGGSLVAMGDWEDSAALS